MNYEIEHVLSVHNEIGEAPLWVPEEQTVYWTDTEANMVWSYKPKPGAKESWTVNPPVTAITRREKGAFCWLRRPVWPFRTGTQTSARPLPTLSPIPRPSGSTAVRWTGRAGS
jgi:sugar lactone lactonase YvrE